MSKRNTVSITVSAERRPGGDWSIAVPEYPDVTASCLSKQNIAKTARNAVSVKAKIPASRLVVTKVELNG